MWWYGNGLVVVVVVVVVAGVGGCTAHGLASPASQKNPSQNLGQINPKTKGKSIFLEVILTPVPK